MKKTIYLLFSVMLSVAVITSCKQTSTESNTPSEEGNTKTTTTAEVSASDNIVVNDLQINDLNGPVKICSIKKGSCDEKGETGEDTYWGETVLAFDQKGFIDEKSEMLSWNLPNPKISRNDKQQMTKVEWYVSDFDTNIGQEFTYQPDGKLQSIKFLGVESNDVTTYTYNENGTLASTVSLGAGEGSIFRSSHTFTILGVDDHGNWLRRLSKCTFESGPDDGSNQFTDSMDDYEIEIRAIIYY